LVPTSIESSSSYLSASRLTTYKLDGSQILERMLLGNTGTGITHLPIHAHPSVPLHCCSVRPLQFCALPLLNIVATTNNGRIIILVILCVLILVSVLCSIACVMHFCCALWLCCSIQFAVDLILWEENTQSMFDEASSTSSKVWTRHWSWLKEGPRSLCSNRHMYFLSCLWCLPWVDRLHKDDRQNYLSLLSAIQEPKSIRSHQSSVTESSSASRGNFPIRT